MYRQKAKVYNWLSFCHEIEVIHVTVTTIFIMAFTDWTLLFYSRSTHLNAQHHMQIRHLECLSTADKIVYLGVGSMRTFMTITNPKTYNHAWQKRPNEQYWKRVRLSACQRHKTTCRLHNLCVNWAGCLYKSVCKYNPLQFLHKHSPWATRHYGFCLF